jgi:hypothetical protein
MKFPLRLFVCVCVYVCMYVCIYVYMYVCTYKEYECTQFFARTRAQDSQFFQTFLKEIRLCFCTRQCFAKILRSVNV